MIRAVSDGGGGTVCDGAYIGTYIIRNCMHDR